MNTPTIANAITMIAKWLTEHPSYRFDVTISIGIRSETDTQNPIRWKAGVHEMYGSHTSITTTNATFEEAVIKLAQIVVEKP